MSTLATSQERINQFKAGIDKNESRRKRQELTLNTRRNRRVENLRKKRNVGTGKELDLGDLSSSDLPQLLNTIMGPDPTLYEEAVKSIKKLLSQESNPPIDEIARHPEVIQKMVSFLSSSNVNLQFEAAWALTNIASGSSNHTIAVVQANAIPEFIKLMSHHKEQIREQSVWALGNISGESHECRDCILNYHGMDALIPNLQSSNLNLVQNSAWTVSNLCRGKPKPDWKKVSAAVAPICALLDTCDLRNTETIADCLWALSYLSDRDDKYIQKVVEHLNINRVLNIIKGCDPDLILPGIRTLGNVVSGTLEHTEIAVNLGVIPIVTKILQTSTKRSVQKEGIWLISNIVATEARLIQLVIESGVIENLIFNLLVNGQHEVKRECLWTVANIVACGSTVQVDSLVRKGIFRYLVPFLDTKDTKLLKIALKTLEEFFLTGEKISQSIGTPNPYLLEFEKADGVDSLEELQDHELDEIYQLAVDLVETYFNDEEEVISDNQWGTFAPSSSNVEFNF